jgi:hypothetical protein
MKSTALPKTNRATRSKPAKIVFYLPPGARLSDVFIDGPQVIQELFIHKRTLSNWRKDGRITFTNRFGKIFYFKQEIARLLIEGKQGGKKISKSSTSAAKNSGGKKGGRGLRA